VLSNLIEDLKRIWNLKVLHFQIATFSNFQILNNDISDIPYHRYRER
jgi:hypothetical protein